MPGTVTLWLPDEKYQQLRTLAERENRPLSNFIETATLRDIETEQSVGEFEMEEIRVNRGQTTNFPRGACRAV